MLNNLSEFTIIVTSVNIVRWEINIELFFIKQCSFSSFVLIHRSCYLVNVIKDPHSLFCRCVTINKHNNLHLLMKIIITLFLSGVFYPPPFIIIKNPLFSLSENGLKQMLIHEKRSFHLIFIRIWKTCFRLERLLGRKYSNW